MPPRPFALSVCACVRVCVVCGVCGVCVLCVCVLCACVWCVVCGVCGVCVCCVCVVCVLCVCGMCVCVCVRVHRSPLLDSDSCGIVSVVLSCQVHTFNSQSLH